MLRCPGVALAFLLVVAPAALALYASAGYRRVIEPWGGDYDDDPRWRGFVKRL